MPPERVNARAAAMLFTTMDIFSGPWKQQAACREYPMPENDHLWAPKSRRAHEDAKQICDDCPVNAQCLVYARQLDRQAGSDKFVVMAGMTGYERRALYRLERREQN